MTEKQLTIYRGYRYRLYPDDEQALAFERTAGVCRFVWNLALEQREVWGRHRRINFATQCQELTALRAECLWISEVTQDCQTQALRDLDGAFGRFLKGQSRFPRFKKRGVRESFRYKGRTISVEAPTGRFGRVRLPKIGWVRLRMHRPISGEVLNATVMQTALGWEISFATKEDIAVSSPAGPSVGIDRGVAVPLMLSDGTEYHLPPGLRKAEDRARAAQKRAARKVRGSNRQKKFMRRAARAKAKVGRIRAQWQHEVTTAIARRFGYVAMERLRTASMTRSARGTLESPGKKVAQKGGLNRAILNVGWYGLEVKLAYKMEQRGGALVFVPAKNTSLTCASCGAIDAKSRESQARFSCRHCGHSDNADRNAAHNILALSRGSAEALA